MCHVGVFDLGRPPPILATDIISRLARSQPDIISSFFQRGAGRPNEEPSYPAEQGQSRLSRTRPCELTSSFIAVPDSNNPQASSPSTESTCGMELPYHAQPHYSPPSLMPPRIMSCHCQQPLSLSELLSSEKIDFRPREPKGVHPISRTIRSESIPHPGSIHRTAATTMIRPTCNFPGATRVRALLIST